VISGRLEDVDLFSLTQFLKIQKKTGLLEINLEGGKAAQLAFAEGEVVNAWDQGEGSAEDAALRLFKERKGDFAFYSTRDIGPRRIDKATDSMLLELAVKMDEAASESQETPAVVTAEAKPKQGRRVPVVAALADQRALSQTQLVRAVEEKLVIYAEDLPEETGKQYWESIKAKTGPGAKVKRPVLVLVSIGVTAAVLLLAFAILRAPKRKKETRPVQDKKVVKPPAQGRVLPYTYLTGPGTPERKIEDSIKDINFRCNLRGIRLTGQNKSQVSLTFKRDVFWDKVELREAAAWDAANTIKKIFDKCSNISKIQLKVLAHLTPGDADKWDTVLSVDAERKTYLEDLDPSHPEVFLKAFRHSFQIKAASSR